MCGKEGEGGTPSHAPRVKRERRSPRRVPHPGALGVIPPRVQVLKDNRRVRVLLVMSVVSVGIQVSSLVSLALHPSLSQQALRGGEPVYAQRTTDPRTIKGRHICAFWGRWVIQAGPPNPTGGV